MHSIPFQSIPFAVSLHCIHIYIYTWIYVYIHIDSVSITSGVSSWLPLMKTPWLPLCHDATRSRRRYRDHLKVIPTPSWAGCHGACLKAVSKISCYVKPTDSLGLRSTNNFLIVDSIKMRCAKHGNGYFGSCHSVFS